MKKFNDKVALVTGAGNGFGKVVAIEAARRGMKVALVDIDRSDIAGVKILLRQLGVNDVVTIQADVSIQEETKHVVEEVMAQFGSIDILFDNAGVSPLADITTLPVKDFEWGMTTNLYARAYMLHEVLPIMIEQGTPAHIIEVSSIAGILHGLGNGVTYSASKHANVALAEDIRSYCKANEIDNIGVSVFCPGFIQTDLHHCERHRPERFTDTENPFYSSEIYKQLQDYLSISIQTGIPIDEIGFRLFKAIEDEQMYILTHPKFLEKIEARHRAIEKDFEPKDALSVTVDYTDKVAFITGAAHGFGYEFAKEAQRQHMKLALVDIDTEALEKFGKELEAKGADVLILPTDTSVYEEVQSSVQKTMDTYGQIDVLFNNAGVAATEDLINLHPQDWDWVLGVNLMGQTYVLKEVLPIMIKQKTQANVITTASIAGLIPGFGFNPTYSSSKHGSVAVSEAIKNSLELQNIDYIKIQLFCPAFIQTNLHHSESYRPERFSIDNAPEHYQTEGYKESQKRLEHNITTGIPIDGISERLFQAMEADETYIITHPENLPYVEARHREIEADCKRELTLWDIYDKMY
ncbi:MAG: SDR family NAD(P)-dependent oxidoreductase [Aerococcus sp.]|nr:SDR family NAD(P)-dependent oxidoreductase [Aerococcus sp.]